MEKFNSRITNCILIFRKDDVILDFKEGKLDGLCDVHMDGYLLCPLEQCDVKTISKSIPEFMRASLFLVLKTWFKAWIPADIRRKIKRIMFPFILGMIGCVGVIISSELFTDPLYGAIGTLAGLVLTIASAFRLIYLINKYQYE